MSLYVVLEQAPKDLDPNLIDGKALAHSEPALTQIATQLGVVPLMDFFSISVEEVGELFEDDDISLDELNVPALQWFTASEGLVTVRALRQYLQQTPDAVDSIESVVSDLTGFEQILTEAEQQGIRWHLAIDY